MGGGEQAGRERGREAGRQGRDREGGRDTGLGGRGLHLVVAQAARPWQVVAVPQGGSADAPRSRERDLQPRVGGPLPAVRPAVLPVGVVVAVAQRAAELVIEAVGAPLPACSRPSHCSEAPLSSGLQLGLAGRSSQAEARQAIRPSQLTLQHRGCRPYRTHRLARPARCSGSSCSSHLPSRTGRHTATAGMAAAPGCRPLGKAEVRESAEAGWAAASAQEAEARAVRVSGSRGSWYAP